MKAIATFEETNVFIVRKFNLPALLNEFSSFERRQGEISRHFVCTKRAAVRSAPIGQFLTCMARDESRKRKKTFVVNFSLELSFFISLFCYEI